MIKESTKQKFIDSLLKDLRKLDNGLTKRELMLIDGYTKWLNALESKK